MLGLTFSLLGILLFLDTSLINMAMSILPHNPLTTMILNSNVLGEGILGLVYLFYFFGFWFFDLF